MPQINKISLNHSRQPENTVFLKDAIDFFTLARSGHMGIWRYSEPLYAGDPVNGMHHWAEFVKKARAGSDYYAYRDEIDVIKRSIPMIAKEIKGGLSIIDLGPGSIEAVLEKPGHLLKNLDSIQSYIGVDIVPECLDRARATVQSYFPRISCETYCTDFYKGKFPTVSGLTPIMVFFGQTMFNFPVDPLDETLPEEVTVSTLKKLRMHVMRTGGYLIVTQDTNQDSEELRKAYMTEKEFDMNLLYRIQRDLPISGDYDPSYFDYDPYFVKSTGAAAHTYITNTNLKFSIGKTQIYLNKGQRLYMHNTYKFTASFFSRMAEKAGYEVIGTEFSTNHRAALHLLRVNAP